MTARYWFDRAVAADPTYRHQLAQELLAHRKPRPYLTSSKPPYPPGIPVRVRLIRAAAREDVIRLEWVGAAP